jgi:hypothetical protein
MAYRYVTISENAFVQQLAVAYVNHGYWYYVTGFIPPEKDVAAVDRKLIGKYDIAISKWARARRKRQGLANVHYLRFQRFFVLIATAGQHPFYREEALEIRDVRSEPIRYAGYSIGYRQGVDRKWHVSVRIHPKQYCMIRDYFLEICVHRSMEQISKELQFMPFEAYAPVRRQMLNILRAVNRRRRSAGLGPVPIEALRLRRRILKPFICEQYQTLEIERCAGPSGLEDSEFSSQLREYRHLASDGRPVNRGIQR